jgi:hypothetical protein
MLLRLISRLRSWLAPLRPPARRQGTMLEPLESRIAPATLISPHVVTYTDIDGDHVTVTSSLPIFNSTNASSVLHFNTGSVDGSNTTMQQLQTIDLVDGFTSSKLVSGDNLSVTVVKAGGGDGYANVGYIESSYALGHVTVQGDLGRIEAGVTGPVGVNSNGLASLTVHSLGVQGIGTQAGTGNLLSSIYGSIGSITVQTDMTNAAIAVVSNTAGATANGNVGSIFIGNNLTGGANGTDSKGNVIMSGSIATNGNVGSIHIGGSILGGSGSGSASLNIGGKLGSIYVGGNITGYTVSGDTTGQGADSASISTGNYFPNKGGIGSITVKGSVTGGDGQGSAEFSNATISTSGALGSITIGGDVIGGSGANSAEFLNTGSGIGPVKIGGKLAGGSGQDSGEINAVVLSSISIGKGIVGSSGINSGLVTSANGIGAITIGANGITGGTVADSGAILAGTAPTSTGTETIPSIVIYGDITSTAATGSLTTQTPGQINSAVPIGSLTLHGSVIGSAGDNSGTIIDSEPISHVTLLANGSTDHGSILGGAGSGSGKISALSFSTVSIAGQITGSTGTGSGIVVSSLGIGSISAGGIGGGGGDESGQINAGTTLGSVHLTGAIAGGGGTDAGGIFAVDNIGSITAAALTYGAGSGSGQISAGDNLGALAFTGVANQSTTVSGLVTVIGSVGSISVKGDIAGTGADTGLFNIGGAINTLSITGALRGGTGLDSGSIFAGLDNTSHIGSITVTGGIVGGGGGGSGEIFSGGGINTAILGDLTGGAGQFSGSIYSDGPIGAVQVTGTSTQVTHGIIGAGGDGSGVISSGTTLGSVTVHGSIAGGGGTGSGAIVSNSTYTPSGDVQGNIGAITVTGSVTGGTGANSGQISAAGNLTTVSIAGSVTGSNFSSNAVSGTGAILAGTHLTGVTGGNITTLKIGGSLTGGNIAASAGDVTGSGYIEAGHIGSAIIGSVQAGTVGTAGTVTADGAILAANDIASLTVTGAIQGASTNAVTISAVGQVTPGKLDLAFGKISVGTNVSYANFLAGYDQCGTPVNGAASIGTVVVGGDWSGSNLVAGVIAGSNGNFGASNDTLITTSSSVVPTIASIIIKGHVTSATPPGASDTYGFVAKQINSISVDGKVLKPIEGTLDPVDQSTDTDLREVTKLST